MKVTLGIITVLIVLVVVGVLVFRVTAPEGDVVPEGEAILEEEEKPVGNGQFLQLLPEEVLSVEEADQGVSEADEVVGDVEGLVEGESGVDLEVTTDMDMSEIISMTDIGFRPDVIEVERGTKVKFVNDGQALHWPTADIFDSGRAVATGDKYEYVFDEVGTWDFLDQLNPQFTGTITVKE